MKKFKFLLLAFIAFVALGTSVKAATLPELFVTVKGYNVGDMLGQYDTNPEYDYVEVSVGDTVQLEAITAHGNDMPSEETPAGWYVDEVGLNATYSSNNTSIATVDANGLVTALSNGTAVITVSYNGSTKTFEIRVTNERKEMVKNEDTPSVISTNNDKDVKTIGEEPTTTEEITTTGEKDSTETIGAAEPKKDDNGLKLYEIIIISVAAVVLVISVVILVRGKSKSKSKEENAE